MRRPCFDQAGSHSNPMMALCEFASYGAFFEQQNKNKTRDSTVRSLSILLACGLLACASAHASPIVMTDQTAAAGLDFVHAYTNDHQSGPMSGGGAVGDFNNDGYPDIFALGSGGRADALYINQRNGTFVDQSEQWGLDELHRGVGATVADYDGDGDDDIYVTSFGAMTENAGMGRHRLYRNDGGVFTDVAQEAGVATSSTTHPDGYGATFGDYDLDGDLDLFVGAWHNARFVGSRLFRNDGDGRFSDATRESGILQGPTRAFGVIFADMDGDRFPEMLVAGDFGTTRYYRNNRDATFDELDPGSGLMIKPEPGSWTTPKAHNAMGTAVGDFNRDGQLDWFITAIWPTAALANDFWGNGLYLNHGDHIFTEVAENAGVHDGGWGWGTEAVDFDNDGWTDLAMTNGWPFTDPVSGASFDGERSYLWRNRGDLSFEDVGPAAGFMGAAEGRTMLTLDYDLDGDLDIAVLGNQSALQLHRNDLIMKEPPVDAHWLQVILDTSSDASLAPHGLGARVTVIAQDIKSTIQVTSGGTYLGQSERVAHFGLGRATLIKKLLVEWPDGRRTRLDLLPADQRITIRPPLTRSDRAIPVSRGRLRLP